MWGQPIINHLGPTLKILYKYGTYDMGPKINIIWNKNECSLSIDFCESSLSVFTLFVCALFVCALFVCALFASFSYTISYTIYDIWFIWYGQYYMVDHIFLEILWWCFRKWCSRKWCFPKFTIGFSQQTDSLISVFQSEFCQLQGL